MSATTVFYVGAGVAFVAAVVGALTLFRSDNTVDPVSKQWLASPDDRQWEREARTMQHTGLAAVRETATSWGETVAAFLGIFSVAAFVKGPEAFTDVKGSEAEVAALLVLLATVVAAAAILFAAVAAQGVPARVANLDGWTLKQLTMQRAHRAASQLAVSRFLTVAAALLILGAVGLTWLTALEERDEKDAEDAPLAIVVPLAGQPVVCGQLGSATEALTIKPEGAERAVVIRGARSVRIVSACPKP